MNLFDQHAKAKESCPDHLVLVRVGDFYEAFGDDAYQVAKIIGLVVTKRRTLTTGETLDMTGFPYHSLDRYLQKLVAAGKQVAIIDETGYAPAELIL